MAIQATVGKGGRNEKSDVSVVQAALNENIDRNSDGAERLVVDGGYGVKTQREITRFQKDIMGVADPDGIVSPGGAMLTEMAQGFSGELNPSLLEGIMPAAQSSRVDLYLPFLVRNMAKRAITTPLRVAHFLAQIGHESGALRFNEEIASGAAYEGRSDLGNTQPGDGRRFKGRGLIQLTGRANYKQYGAAIGVDLTVDDNWLKVAEDPSLAVDVACWFWETREINALADADDVKAVTRKINGGLNGLEDREGYLGRSRYLLAV